MQLTKSPVLFTEEPHEYWLGDKQLQGITQVVNWIYPLYDGISKKILDNAAARGKRIHHLCQEYDEREVVSEDEQVQDYIYLTADLKHVASEYIVSDEKDYASAIDKIYNGTEGGVILGDIKCSSQLHVENVTLQLSIYAMLFERMNPDVKAEKLIAIWLPDRKYAKSGSIYECQRIPSDICEKILHAYIEEPWSDNEWKGKISETTLPAIPQTAVKKFKDFTLAISNIESHINKLKEDSERLRGFLLEAMKEYGVKKWDGEYASVTYKLPSTRQSLDSKKVKELYPDVYADCVKESETKESLLIKIK